MADNFQNSVSPPFETVMSVDPIAVLPWAFENREYNMKICEFKCKAHSYATTH